MGVGGGNCNQSIVYTCMKVSKNILKCYLIKKKEKTELGRKVEKRRKWTLIDRDELW